VARVKELAGRTPAGEWILAEDDEGRPAEFRPPDLDAATIRHPVVLDRIDGHSI
jgi:predicted amidohydrolase YtcJ